MLDRDGFSHRIDEDGDIVGILSADEDCPYDVACLIQLGGKDKDILSIRLIGAAWSPSATGAAVLACNKWNNDTRLPKAYLSSGPEPRITAEHQIGLESGIHDELLSEFIHLVMAGDGKCSRPSAKRASSRGRAGGL